MKRLLTLVFSTLLLMKGTPVAAASPENTLYLDLKDGRVVIELLPEKAPNHVKRIKELARKGFYDGVVFHRVIDGFMAQTGDPTGTGTGGSGQKINAEFNDVKHVRGTVSMARASSPNSADSQFFICFADATFLDGQYTAFGQVTEGMELVDKIKKGNSANNGSVSEPDKVVKAQIAADATDAAPATTPAKPAAASKKEMDDLKAKIADKVKEQTLEAPATKAPAATEKAEDAVKEKAAKVVTGDKAPAVKSATDKVAETATEKVVDKATEAATEKATEIATEAVKDKAAEAVKEKATEAVKEKAVDAAKDAAAGAM